MKAPVVPSAGGGNMSLGKYNSGAGRKSKSKGSGGPSSQIVKI